MKAIDSHHAQDDVLVVGRIASPFGVRGWLRINAFTAEAESLLEEDPETYYMTDQFNNQDNIEAHVTGTGPEIYEQTGGEVDWFVAGMGTTGTLMGVSRYLKGVKTSVSIVGVEPKMGHKEQGLKNMSEAIVPGIYELAELERKVLIQDEDAYETSKRLSNREGIFAGMSSGAALKAAIDLSAELDSGTIVVLLPDRGDRYVTTALYCNERCRTVKCRVEHCQECPVIAEAAVGKYGDA